MAVEMLMVVVLVVRMMLGRLMLREARLEVVFKMRMRPRRLRRLRRPVVLGDVDLEALPGGVVLVAVDALEGPVVSAAAVGVEQLVLAAVHVRLQVPLGRGHVGALREKRLMISVPIGLYRVAILDPLVFGQRTGKNQWI